MKISSKFGIVCALWLLVSTAVYANVKVDLNNAVQHIGSVKIQNQDGSGSATLSLSSSKVRIVTDNFLITKKYDDLNSIDGESSSILWWVKNRVLSSGSTIIAWTNNTIESDTSIIWWWKNNRIESNSDNSVIMWWRLNQIVWMASAILWWSSNSVDWNNSVVWWNNSSVTWDYSVALWSGAKVIWNNSFLWSDGSNWEILNVDNVFAVVSKRGMVVNATTAHEWAQLTVSWSLYISQSENDNNIVCGDWKWAWVVKLINKNDKQKCICSCNGNDWDSLLWNWECRSKCNGSVSMINPETACWTTLTMYTWVDASWNIKRFYSWSCEQWTVIEGSYYMFTSASWSKLYWSCQETDWSVVSTCWYELKCKWEENIPKTGAQINNTIAPDLQTDYVYRYSPNKWQLCSFSCISSSGYFWNESRGTCDQWCSTTWDWCAFWSRVWSPATWTTGYLYTCEYPYLWNPVYYSCSRQCNGGKIWDWSGCVAVNACWNKSCKQWDVSNFQTLDYEYTWDCVGSWNTLIQSCSTGKNEVEKVVFYNLVNNGSDNYVSFTLSGWSIGWDINIRLPYDSTESIFSIYAGDESSLTLKYGSVTFWTPVPIQDRVVVWDTVYHITITQKTNAWCVNVCSMAWSCAGWGNGTNFNKTLSWNTAKFTWKCWSESCIATCNVRTSSCSKVATVSHWTICNPKSDTSCIPFKWNTVNLWSFYMEEFSETILATWAWAGRYCTSNTSSVSCTPYVSYQNPEWFKCNSWYARNWCSCVTGSSICNNTNTSNTWTCNYWATITYSWANWESSYNYSCKLDWVRYSCTASCATGKYWWWSGVWCISLQLCWEDVNWSRCLLESREDWYLQLTWYNKSTWTCTKWEKTDNCSRCFSWYVLSGNGTDCVAAACPQWEINGAMYPDLSDGSHVDRFSKDGSCLKEWRITCTSWSVSATELEWSRVCACNGDTNPWSCRTWTAQDYHPRSFKTQYEYSCWTWWDICRVDCTWGKVWLGKSSGCVSTWSFSICSGTHFNCLYWWTIVAWSTWTSINNGSWEYYWGCKTWDVEERCSEIFTSYTWCVAQTVSWYNVPALNHNTSTWVSQNKDFDIVNSWIYYTGTATCDNSIIIISSERSTSVCPWGTWWTPKCNLFAATWWDIWNATWKTWYQYDCWVFKCSRQCPTNYYWNGDECEIVAWATACDNSVTSWCNMWYPSNLSWSNSVWYVWDCINSVWDPLNSEMCHKCNETNWYFWDSASFRCIKSVEINFNSNWWTHIDSQSVRIWETIVEPSVNPTFPWYIFRWWYSNAWLSNRWNFDTPVTGSMTLYAKRDYNYTFNDLDVYIISNTGRVVHKTLMDRNLWAATDISSADSYWYYYQRWNNYWFSQDAATIPTTGKKVSADWYGPFTEWYARGLFVKTWAWDSSNNSNLWGALSAGSDSENTRWPCPEWYHVPLLSELNILVAGYKSSDSLFAYFRSWFLLPIQGVRSITWGQIINDNWDTAVIWFWASDAYSSSEGKAIVIFRMISNGSSHVWKWLWMPIRCFKDSTNSAINVDPMGWTWAVVSISNNKLVSSLSPTKSWYIFLWWYSNSQWGTLISVWDNLPSNNSLYARWDKAYCTTMDGHNVPKWWTWIVRLWWSSMSTYTCPWNNGYLMGMYTCMWSSWFLVSRYWGSFYTGNVYYSQTPEASTWSCDGTYTYTSTWDIYRWSFAIWARCTWYSVSNGSCQVYHKYKVLWCTWAWYNYCVYGGWEESLIEGCFSNSEMINQAMWNAMWAYIHVCETWSCRTPSWVLMYNWQSITKYKIDAVNCPDTCESQKNTYTCTNGTISNWNNSYNYPDCGILDSRGSCTTDYTLTGIPSNATYYMCTWYSVSYGSCKKYNKYKINKCKEWYKKSWNACVEDPDYWCPSCQQDCYKDWTETCDQTNDCSAPYWACYYLSSCLKRCNQNYSCWFTSNGSYDCPGVLP